LDINTQNQGNKTPLMQELHQLLDPENFVVPGRSLKLIALLSAGAKVPDDFNTIETEKLTSQPTILNIINQAKKRASLPQTKYDPTKMSDEIALKAFKEQLFPCGEAIDYILDHPHLTTQVLQEPDALTLLNDRDETLWEAFLTKCKTQQCTLPNQMKTFELIGDKMFSDGMDKARYFCDVCAYHLYPFVHRLITNKKIQPQDLDAQQTYSCWIHLCGDRNTLMSFKIAGFDVNAKDQLGRTTLFYLATRTLIERLQLFLEVEPAFEGGAQYYSDHPACKGGMQYSPGNSLYTIKDLADESRPDTRIQQILKTYCFQKLK
jgi:hypothetical protein